MELTHGTLVIAVQGREFIVLGADSKGMLGDLGGPIVIGSTRARKITLLSNHVGVATYGVGEFGENLLLQYQNARRKDLDGVTTIVEELRTFCRDKWSEWFRDIDVQARPPLGLMIAGLDKDQNEEYSVPRIYSIESMLNFAPALHPYGYACRGIPALATFIMDKKYREDMSVDELCDLVESTITRIAQTDPRIGIPVRVALITPKEGARMVRE